MGGVIGIVAAFGISTIVGCFLFSDNPEACSHSPYVAVFFLGLPAVFIGGIIGLIVGLLKRKKGEGRNQAGSASEHQKMHYGYVFAFVGASLITFFHYILASESSGDQSLIPWPLMGLLSFGSLAFLVWFLKRKRSRK